MREELTHLCYRDSDKTACGIKIKDRYNRKTKQFLSNVSVSFRMSYITCKKCVTAHNKY